MALTYEPIAQTVLQSATASVVFGNLSGYTDLHVVAVTKSTNTSGNAAIGLVFNNDTATNYSNHWFAYYNGAVYTESNANLSGIGSTTRLNVVSGGDARWGIAEWDILSYANTTTNKTVLGWSFADQELLKVSKGVGVWRSTSAITSLTFTPSSGNFATGSTFCVYGILAA